MNGYDTEFLTNSHNIINQIKTVVVGKNKTLLWVLATILAKGHILMEDIPGVGKTTMAKAFAKTLGLTSNRVQFTPDVLPSDVTGFSILDQKTGELQYKSGAVLCNLFLADELNRATSRTQSALLEAMEEGQVTVDGVTHSIPQPFIVIATQNPTGAAGTQPLPDSQKDRFMVQISLGYPAAEDEIAMVAARQGRDPLETLKPVISMQELVTMQNAVANTYISDEMIQYAVSLIRLTRDHPKIEQGASPRATLALVSMAKSFAMLRGRDYVIPRDIQDVFFHTVAHRINWKPDVKESDWSTLMTNILRSIPAPQLR